MQIFMMFLSTQTTYTIPTLSLNYNLNSSRVCRIDVVTTNPTQNDISFMLF